MQAIDKLRADIQLNHDEIERLNEKGLELKLELTKEYFLSLKKDKLLSYFSWEFSDQSENYISILSNDTEGEAFNNLCRLLGRPPADGQLGHFRYDFQEARLTCDDGTLELTVFATSVPAIDALKSFAKEMGIVIGCSNLETEVNRLQDELNGLKELQKMFEP